MPAPRVYTEEAINEAWEATGSIRETARRVGSDYNTIYERLRKANKIVAPAFTAGDSQHQPRTIPDNVTLIKRTSYHTLILPCGMTRVELPQCA